MTVEPVTPRGEDLAHPRSLWSREFLLLLGATFLAYANISVFFHFYQYLHTLPIDPRWFGLLISIFSAVPLILRPVMSSLFHSGNADRYLLMGTLLLVLSLFSYSLASGFWGMFIVRALHGLAFAILGTALMTITVAFIPKEKSAQVFGLLSLLTLIPNTMIPPVLPFLTQGLGGFTHVLMLFAGITILVFPLVWGTGRAGIALESALPSKRLGRKDILEDLKNVVILSILAAMLLLYSGCALVFFFLDSYGRSIGIEGTGFFLTLSTIAEIGVRLVAGSFFDRFNKIRLATWTMAGLAISYVCLAHVPGRATFFALGVFLGLGWGVAMPVFSGLMFDISEAKFRAFNINLTMQMFQGGFFLGPFLGAPVVTHWGFTTLFYMSAVFSALSAGLIFHLGGKMKSHGELKT